jgi:DNA-binding IclR family transcriptional regulator
MGTKSNVPALEKGFKVLEYLAQTSEFRTLTQIANANGYNLSEIQRTINFLVESGYLIKNQTGAYYLSSKLYRIANQNPPHQKLLSCSIVPMEEFVIETGESVHLCVLIETQAHFIGQIEGTRITRLTMRLGSYPAHKTTSGKLLIALTKPDLISHIKEDKNTLTKLKRLFNSIQKNGYYSSKSEYTSGVHDISVPIHLPGVGVIAAVATSFLYSVTKTESADKKERSSYLVDKLLETSEKISNKFEVNTD